ncbi:MAG: fucose isomerase, partial [Clostridia bacterium]|nr:fucose isomerase [Clostridia bacterium]
MLKGISPLLSPDLLKTLCEMGHGELIVFADANFPAHSCRAKVIDASGLLIPDLLRGVMPLIELDQYVKNPVFMMQPVSGDKLDEAYMKECC